MKDTRFVILLLAVILTAVSVTAQYPPEALKGLWSAQWITSPSAPQRDSAVLHFRKELRLTETPAHFIVHVSADNQFLLYVNGREVGRGPARSDLGHWKYETYDLAPFLHSGENVLAATVWNFGIYSQMAQISDRIAFVLEGDGEAERAADTNATWDVEIEKGLQPLPTPVEMQRFYYVAEPAERIDGAVFDWAWNQSGVTKSKWEKATAIGSAELRESVLQHNNWLLVPDSLPAMQMELQPGGRVVRTSIAPAPSGFPGKPLTVAAHSKVSILLDNASLTTAYPELEVSGGTGSTVRLTYAEALMDEKGEKGNRNEISGKHIVGIYDEFLPDGAEGRRFMPLAWRTWRYLQIDVTTADQPVRLDNFHSWFTAYPFEERAQFTSDDNSLKPIWDIGWRTARLDAHDTYMDTPYWERMQYVGDTRIQAMISYAVAGDDRLARQAIQAFNDSRITDGLTRSRYPSSLIQVIPTFSLLWVGMVHNFWMYRGDEAFVRAQLPGTRGVLDWFLARQRQDGLMGTVNWWPFVDWGKDFPFGMPAEDENGGSSIVTLQFIEALRYGAELESAYGDRDRAQEYREAEERAALAVRQLCWNETYGLLADTPGQKHYSQHANILGVWLDVIPREKQKDVLTKILSTSDSGFDSSGALPAMTTATYYFRFYLARAVEHAGMGDRYLSLLQPWRDMVALGLTTWAENPEPTRSDSHAWSAHPNFDLLTIVAGIRPEKPGFARVKIEPHLGALKHVTAALPSAKGLIQAEYTETTSGVRAEITLPSNVTGDFFWKGKSFPLYPGHQELLLP